MWKILATPFDAGWVSVKKQNTSISRKQETKHIYFKNNLEFMRVPWTHEEKGSGIHHKIEI